MMQVYDAIIVGAGPAGSTCAARLHQAGLNVKLFDKKVFPRVKPCAGWVTPQVIESLQIDTGEYRRHNTFQPITGFRTGIIGGRVVETNYAEPVSYGILRIEFDDYLLRRSGVACEFQSVKQISRANGSWVVNESCVSPLLIGAGGHFCPVARMLRNDQTFARSPERGNGDTAPVVYAQEVEFEMASDSPSFPAVEAHRPELYFCPDLQGYGWCFRKGNFLNVGLGRLDKTGLSKHMAAFWQFLRARNKLSAPLPSQFHGHAYRLYAESSPKLCDDGVMLIGDSAGLAYPHSGEGIRPAIESAIIAADVIARVGENYDLQSLSAYERRLIQRLGAVQSLQGRQWLPVAWLQKLAAGLMATRWFARNTVIENWFLHRDQPALKI
ncbi:MAG: NAD(P)/FAD-dependent oxidoreductase [Pirellulaceae bacterium]